MRLSPVGVSLALLAASNVFMAFSWYAHLKEAITLAVFVPLPSST